LTLRWPIAKEEPWRRDAEAHGLPRGDESLWEGAFVKALIIDDSKAMRSILSRMLQGLGFEVLEASNGREGLQRLQAIGKVDLALVDWNMPEMNGLEFIRTVRAEQSYDGVLLMMVTTETEMENVVRALAAGANEYVMKPFTQEIILEKLQIFGMAGA
jgi:two-component system chemotaxis response regulator CheY